MFPFCSLWDGLSSFQISQFRILLHRPSDSSEKQRSASIAFNCVYIRSSKCKCYNSEKCTKVREINEEINFWKVLGSFWVKIFNAQTQFPFSGVEKMKFSSFIHKENHLVALGPSMGIPVAYLGRHFGQGTLHCTWTQHAQSKDADNLVVMWGFQIMRVGGGRLPGPIGQVTRNSSGRSLTPVGVIPVAPMEGESSAELPGLWLSPVRTSAVLGPKRQKPVAWREWVCAASSGAGSGAESDGDECASLSFLLSCLAVRSTVQYSHASYGPGTGHVRSTGLRDDVSLFSFTVFTVAFHSKN